MYFCILILSKGCLPKKKTVKFGTLAQKVGEGLASIPILFDILVGTNTVGGRGLKGPCHKKMKYIFAHNAQVLWILE